MKTRTLLLCAAAMTLLPLSVAAEETFDYTYFDVTYLSNGIDNSIATTDGHDMIDLAIVDGYGIGARGSLALTPHVHAFAGYATSDLDLDALHRVSMPTLAEMQNAFYTTPGMESWDAPCDLNGDGMINAVDLGLLKAAGAEPRIAEAVTVDGNLRDWRVGLGVNGLLTQRVSGYAQLFWEDRNVDFDKAFFAGEVRDASAADNGFGATVGARGKVTDKFELTGNVTFTPVGDIDLLADTSAGRLNSNTVVGVAGQYWFTDTFSMMAGVEGDNDIRAWTLGVRYDLGNRF